MTEIVDAAAARAVDQFACACETVQPLSLTAARNELQTLQPIALDRGAMGERGELIENFAAAWHSGLLPNVITLNIQAQLCASAEPGRSSRAMQKS
jgi:hypothetical protein